jgi:hypothetical protein
MNRIALLLAPLLIAATGDDGLTTARFGQTVSVDGPRVTPIRLLTDSRCPMEARCVWAGELRILARVRTGSGSSLREFTLGKPIPVADGALELASAMPPRSVQRPIRMRDYRFGFRFAGGL